MITLPEKVYLAAAYERNAEMRAIRDVLEALGYRVTSRWIDQHGGTDTQAIGAGQLAADPACGAPYAEKDLEDLRAADAVIQFSGGGRGGRHVEFGAALAWSKQLVVVGQREHVFHSLPAVAWYPDWAHLVTELMAVPVP